MTHQLSIDEAIENRNGVLALIAMDPKVSAHIRQVAETIDKVHKPGDLVSANSIRPHLPSWINTTAIGPAFATFVRRGALERAGEVVSTDPGTHGKRITLYRLLNTVTEAAA